MLIACICRIIEGTNVFSTRTPASARSNPRPAPRNASNTLSVKNCRVRRKRLAPSASRNAISFSRAAARASSKLATFAQAIRRTKPTAPSRMSNAGLMSPTISSCNGVTVAPIRVLDLGYCFARRAAIVSISAWACLRPTPGFIRAITSRK